MHRTKKSSFNLIIILVPLVMVTAGGILLFKIIEKKQIVDSRENFIPIEISLPGKRTDPVTISIHNAPIIIMYFEPDCYYCHIETEALLERIDEFSGIDIYLITANEWDEIEGFTAQYNLQNYNRIVTGKICRQDFYESYGARVVPSLFIYDETGKLLYNSSGYTPVTVILEALNR